MELVNYELHPPGVCRETLDMTPACSNWGGCIRHRTSTEVMNGKHGYHHLASRLWSLCECERPSGRLTVWGRLLHPVRTARSDFL